MLPLDKSNTINMLKITRISLIVSLSLFGLISFNVQAQVDLALQSAPFKGWATDSVKGNPTYLNYIERDLVEKFGEWKYEKGFQEVHTYDQRGNFIEITRNDLRREANYSEKFSYSQNKVTSTTSGEDRPYSQWNTPSEKSYSLNSKGLVTEYIGNRRSGYQYNNEVLYEYDAKNRVTKITVYSFDDLFKIITASYQSVDDKPVEIKSFNSEAKLTGRIAYQYDSKNRLSKELHYSKDSYGEKLEKEIVYTYDSDGHISTVEHHGSWDGHTLYKYKYDSAGLLLKVYTVLVRSNGNQEIIEEVQYIHDNQGNWEWKLHYKPHNMSGQERPYKKVSRGFIYG